MIRMMALEHMMLHTRQKNKEHNMICKRPITEQSVVNAERLEK